MSTAFINERKRMKYDGTEKKINTLAKLAEKSNGFSFNKNHSLTYRAIDNL